MKKSIFTITVMALAMLPGSSPAAAAQLMLATSVIEPGEIPGYTPVLEFSLHNEETVFGFQTDITLPDGVTLQSDDNGDSPAVLLSDRLDTSFSYVMNEISPSTVRLAAFSTSGAAVRGNDGVLFSLNVCVADNFKGGDVKTSGTHLTLADNADLLIGGTSRWLDSNYKLYAHAEDRQVRRGSTEQLDIWLANTESYYGIQGKIYLPEGLSFDTDETGYPVIFPIERISEYNLVCLLRSEQELAFGSFSMNGEAFRAGDTPMISFAVKVSDDFVRGEWRADEIMLTSADRHDVRIDGCSAAVSVAEPVNLLTVEGQNGNTVEFDKAMPFSISIENETSIAGFQADIYLPAGISADNFRLTERCSHGFSLSTRLFEEERRVRIVVASLSGSTLQGDFGPFLDFDLTASTSVQAVSYLTIGNIRISDPDGKEYNLKNLTATLNLFTPEPEPEPDIKVDEEKGTVTVTIPEEAEDVRIKVGDDEVTIEISEDGTIDINNSEVLDAGSVYKLTPVVDGVEGEAVYVVTAPKAEYKVVEIPAENPEDEPAKVVVIEFDKSEQTEIILKVRKLTPVTPAEVKTRMAEDDEYLYLTVDEYLELTGMDVVCLVSPDGGYAVESFQAAAAHPENPEETLTSAAIIAPDIDSILSGIAITTGDNLVLYYDLNGRAIKGEPAPGIYIRIEGGKTVKVCIR